MAVFLVLNSLEEWEADTDQRLRKHDNRPGNKINQTGSKTHEANGASVNWHHCKPV